MHPADTSAPWNQKYLSRTDFAGVFKPECGAVSGGYVPAASDQQCGGRYQNLSEAGNIKAGYDEVGYGERISKNRQKKISFLLLQIYVKLTVFEHRISIPMFRVHS